MKAKTKPYAVHRREAEGPRGGRVVLGYEVYDVKTNISLRRLPNARRARELRDELNRVVLKGE